LFKEQDIQFKTFKERNQLGDQGIDKKNNAKVELKINVIWGVNHNHPSHDYQF